jgi:lysine-specific demethylase 3
MRTQTQVCRSRGKCTRPGRYGSKSSQQDTSFWSELPSCFLCQQGRATDATCRFAGYRTIIESSQAGGSPRITFTYPSGGPEPHFPTVFNRDLTPAIIELKMIACARVLLPVLLQELSHTEHPQLIRRERELNVRVTCDICSTALFARSWICSHCGREMCHDCVCATDELGLPPVEDYIQFCVQHCRSNFLPISRFRDNELKEAIEEMRGIIQHDTFDHSREGELDDAMARLELRAEGSPSDETYHERDSPRFRHEDLSDTEFVRHWSYGIPVVVSSLNFQGTWDPAYFIRTYGKKKATIENCETGETKLSNVATFFQQFLDPGQRDGIWKLKVSFFFNFLAFLLTFGCKL